MGRMKELDINLQELENTKLTYSELIDNPELLIEETAKQDIRFFVELQLAMLYESYRVLIESNYKTGLIFQTSVENLVTEIRTTHLKNWIDKLKHQHADRVKFNVDKYVQNIVECWLSRYSIAHCGISSYDLDDNTYKEV